MFYAIYLNLLILYYTAYIDTTCTKHLPRVYFHFRYQTVSTHRNPDPLHTQPEPQNRNSPMKTIVHSPELVSLNLFYFGIIFLLLGSIARRWVEIKKVKDGTMKTPRADGNHSREEKLVMYPLKVIGYLLAVCAIVTQFKYAPGTYRLPVYYALFIAIYFAIPKCFKPQKGFTSRDNWTVQRERLTAAKGMYTVSILLVPTSILAEPLIITQLLLLVVFLYEIFFFSSKEEAVWRDSAHFDLDHSESIELTTEE